MSTIMVDAVASQRLSRQFEAVMRRAHGREANLEARRFIAYLCDRLERNNHSLMAASRNLRADHIFNTAYASRQGEGVLLTCSFLLNDLSARVGRQKITEYLTATQTRAGRALAKRIGARPNDELKISKIRFSTGESGWKAREFLATEAPFAGTGGVVATYRFKGHYPGQLKTSFVIENEGYYTSHFVAVHARLFAQYHKNEAWVTTPGESFAFLEKVAPMEAQVLAMRGFDCMDLLRGADRLNRDPIALRLLARIV
ncbi:MAG: hypothetical protein KDB68_11515 [Planctomycetes bacterium]|nr:hypothetical protein [Planctomycetota bacterium]MCA8936818.1 hypothetical protein [Planctomycetota bacterium]